MDNSKCSDIIDWHGCEAVQFDPDRLGGRATVGESRMDADGVILNYEDGMSVDELYDHFHVDKDAIRSIIAFYEKQQMKISA
jgi:uncharacterized protein (DUF433 family)